MAKRRKFDRNKDGQNLSKRSQQSYEQRNDSGRFRDFFEPSKMEGVSKWWAGKGEHVFDNIPYIAGAYDPSTPEGKSTYLLDLWVHPKVGPPEDTFICPANWKLPCPICEERKLRAENGEDYDTRIKPLNTTRRVVYNIIVRDNGKEEAKGVQIFEIAHWFMEKNLIKIAKDPNGGLKPFHHPDDGESIVFERTGTGPSNTAYDGYRFIPRKKRITDEDLNAAYTLDEMVHRVTYNELKDAFYGVVPPIESEEGNIEYEEHKKREEQEEQGGHEESPQRKPKPKPKKSLKCPVNAVFGSDYDQYEQCDTCAIRIECENES